MLKAVINHVKQLGGVNIYLVAKQPKFFTKNNFIVIDREEAPDFSCCFNCPEYKVICFPEVMKYKGEE